MGKCALIRNQNKLTFSLKKWASEYKQEHSRTAPFIPPPEQSIFEREAPQGIVISRFSLTINIE